MRWGLAAAFVLALLAGGYRRAPDPPLGGGKIEHVVIIIQENRTLDNLFHRFPGAETAESGLHRDGASVALVPIPLAEPYDPDHSHAAFVTEYDGGRLDGFDDERCSARSPCRPDLAFSYVQRSDVEPYWELAQRYVLADRVFQTNEGPSFPAHQYLLAGTSVLVSGGLWYVAGNAHTREGVPGCEAPADAWVQLIEIESGAEDRTAYPCLEHTALTDLVDRAGLTWRYYEVRTESHLWDAPGAIRHIHDSAEYAKDVIAPPSRFFADLASGSLASVTWITPSAAASDHARINDGTGPSWVASIVNAIGKSPYWSSTAIFITWDDWGGWYDHVTPPQYNAYELGFRVPLIVVSAYSKHGYVSHVEHEFGSILRFTEESLRLGSLGYTDARSDNLSDCFDFNAPPQPFAAIDAPLNAEYFEGRPADHRVPDND